MKTLLKNAREQKQLKTRELAQLLGIDQALISKFESGSRKPTREQIVKLATVLEIDYETIMIIWLKEKIIYEIGDESLALKALALAQEEIKNLKNSSLNTVSETLQKIIDDIDLLKLKLTKSDLFESTLETKNTELELIFESNRLDGNTLTIQETDLVINQGLTISGKSMKEHLEVINHHEALAYVKRLAEKNAILNERELLAIHHILSRGIQIEDAGKYRKTNLVVEENSYFPPQPNQIAEEIEGFFVWYELHKNTIHPIILGSEVLLRLNTIQPFAANNDKTARLLMNYIYLQHGYVAASIKGTDENRTHYLQLIEKAQTNNNKESFVLFIAQIVKESLQKYIDSTAK